MPHLLYAALALGLLGMASLGQHRSTRHEQTRAVRLQIETAAHSVAMGLHEGLAPLPFDAVATQDTTTLTPEALFGPTLPEDGFSDATDLDDVHGISETITRTLADPTTGAERSIPFLVTAHVRYVRNSSGVLTHASGARTFTKEVTVTVAHPHLTSPLRLVRTYSS